MGYTVGLYVPRLAVVSWNPLALVGRIEYCSDKDRVEQTVTVPVGAVLCAVQFSCECCRVYVKRFVQSVMCSVQFLVM